MVLLKIAMVNIKKNRLSKVTCFIKKYKNAASKIVNSSELYEVEIISSANLLVLLSAYNLEKNEAIYQAANVKKSSKNKKGFVGPCSSNPIKGIPISTIALILSRSARYLLCWYLI